jgi:hypothetical protein
MMQILGRVLAACVAAVCLLGGAGCAAPDRVAQPGSASTPAPAAEVPASGNAVLYVINASGPTLFSSKHELTDNGHALSSLPRNTWTRLTIAAGPHEFRFRQFPGGRRVARLDAQDGATYYLVSAYNPGRSWAFPIGGDPLVIKLVDAAQAQALMAGMHEQAAAAH